MIDVQLNGWKGFVIDHTTNRYIAVIFMELIISSLIVIS